MTPDQIFNDPSHVLAVIGIFIAIAAIIAGIWVAVYIAKRAELRTDVENNVNTPANHAAYIARLTQSTTDAYDAALQSILIATAYVFGAPNEYGRTLSRRIQFYLSGLAWWRRVMAVLVLVCAVVCMKNLDRITAPISLHVRALVPNLTLGLVFHQWEP